LATERKRSAELHVVNEVAKKALTAADVGDILQAVTASIQKHFAYYDVSLFLLEAERRELALAAGAGAYSRSLSPGYRQPLGVGVIGLVAQSGESLMINDVTKEPRRVLAFPGETTTGSELCVPIKLRGEVLGVINVECERTDAFDQDDLTAMETIADEIAQVVETVRLRAGQRRDHYEADQARRRLEYLCRHAPFGVCTMDLQGVYTHWSEGCERLLGLSASEMIGQKTPAAHIKPPYDLVSDLAQCTRECSTETERAMTRKDGREIIVLDGRVSLYDEDGRHVGFTSYLQDITERKRVEERIRREEKKLHDIVDAIGAGLSLINDRMEVVWVNRALSDWFALRWESIGRRCHEIYRESATPCPDCPAARSFRSGSVHSTEQTLLRPNGQRRYFQHITAPIKDDTGAVRHVLKFTQDITEHAQRVHQLTLLRQLGEAMSGTLDLDRLLHLVLTCVTAGHALGFNRALLLLANESGAALEGKMAVGPLSWADAARIWRELSAQFASLEDFLADYLRKTEHGPMPFQDVMSELVFPVGGESEGVVAQSVRDGKPIVVRDAISDPRVGEKLRAILATPEFVCVPLVAKGRPLGAIIADNLYSGAPITDEHVQLLAMFAAQAALAIENAKAYEKLEDQMRQTREAQDRLLRSERLATVGEMAAHVAHEIRNPLVTIGGFARIILRALDETSPQVAHAKIIVEEVLRLENILKNVMDFTKPSAPQKTQADINRILEDTCDLALSQASATGIALSKSLDPRAARLNADPAQMKQALLNIIRNAVESMDAGGRLALQTRADTRTVTVVISDTGKGIPPEDLNRIFDPFFTTKPQGTGLGLAVTRKIIEDHGGEIRVASAVGQGTTFTITLPR
ncbi:MAG: PAS domain S-box protein, partial [Planctomycetes bacterium]|nr:PAS domain S-box protein [Planctomycetota bacterium]